MQIREGGGLNTLDYCLIEIASKLVFFGLYRAGGGDKDYFDIILHYIIHEWSLRFLS